MTTGLVFHNDLDGLMSAMLIAESGAFEIERVFPVDYGHDHAGIKDQCDQFVIVDYADNITEEKTVLWIDHHLKEEGFELPDSAVIKEAPSCVRLLKDSGMIEDTTLSEEDIRCIDIVDSADYSFEGGFTPEDLLFPDIHTKLGQYTALNQLLMKNRKRNLSMVLIEEMSFDPKTMLYKTNNTGPKMIKYDEYMERKQKLMKKILADPDPYIQYFSGIPVCITKAFGQADWKGYDRNVFYYLVSDSPYVIVTFDMGGQFNFQVSRNLFAPKPEKDVYTIIKEAVDEIRGHENILNFSYDDKSKGLEKLDEIIALLSPEVNESN